MATWKNLALKLPNIPKPYLPERFKGTIVEKWAKYWDGLIHDYAEVFRDTVKQSKEKPYRTALYFSIASGLYYAGKNNPTEMDFRDQVVEYQNLFGLVGKPVRNPNSEVYLKTLENWYNAGVIRRFSLGFFSIMWLDNYDKDVGLYKAQCEYLKPSYLTFHERIIDVGFLNRFWNLERKMEDYDMNPNEWIDFTQTEYEYRHRILN